jgi:hypothetical protein
VDDEAADDQPDSGEVGLVRHLRQRYKADGGGGRRQQTISSMVVATPVPPCPLPVDPTEL